MVAVGWIRQLAHSAGIRLFVAVALTSCGNSKTAHSLMTQHECFDMSVACTSSLHA